MRCWRGPRLKRGPDVDLEIGRRGLDRDHQNQDQHQQRRIGKCLDLTGQDLEQ